MFALAVTLLTTLAVPDGGVAFVSPAKLLEEAQRWKRVGDFERALGLQQVCLELEPKNLDCLLAIGTTLTARAMDANNDADAYQARVAYRRFVEFAPANHPKLQRVKDLLAQSTEPPEIGPLRVPPTPPSRRNRAFLPPSDVVVMPPKVTVPLKGSKTVQVSTIVKLENDNPGAVDATLIDPTKLQLRGRKAGVANLKLYDQDGSWHALRVDVN